MRSIGSDGAEVWSPLPDEELEALRDLVASAVGFNAERGDVLTLKSMPFEAVEGLDPLPPAGLFANTRFNFATLVPLLVLAVVSLILGLFVVRPVLTARAAPALPGLAPAPLPIAGDGSAIETGVGGSQGLDGEITDDAPSFGDLAVVTDDAALPVIAEAPDDPVSRLRLLIDERRDETVEILRHWMEDDTEEPA